MTNQHYDICVIGAGPAGMMAAGIAAQNGASVILIEKNDQPGKKLLLTGKGRCNITRDENDLSEFTEAFGKNGKFLYPALHALGIEDTINFFNSLGLETKTERGQRVFPVNDKATEVLKVLLNFLRKNKVKILRKLPVVKLTKNGQTIEKVNLVQGIIKADKYIVATGGVSYPETGSRGDGFRWAKHLGHTVGQPYPALMSIKTKEDWIKDLQGLSLKNVRISVYQNNRKQDERFGEALFTHEGMSGPIILDMSKKIAQLLKQGTVELKIDLKPALDYPKLDLRLQRDLKAKSNKMMKNCLDDLLPQKLIPVIGNLSGIEPDKKANSVTKEERNTLLHLLKELPVTVIATSGFNKAVITTGGVSLKEIDPRTMKSKLIDNLYFAGEIIDLDGPTGGYNLQLCWSTGYLSGQSAAAA